MPTSPRTRRANALSFFALLFSLAVAVSGQDSDCHITHDGMNYDLSRLGGAHYVQRSRSTPPTMMTDIIDFFICGGELNQKDDVASGDQCPAGTTACLIKTNTKDSESSPQRIVAVIPVAQSSHNPDYTTLESPKGIRITRSGAMYPASDGQQQSLVFDLLCEPNNDAGQPEFMSYDGKSATIQWKHEAACPFKGSTPPPEGDEEKGGDSSSAGSSLGWFFLVLLLAFVAYFVIGAYYNYTTYGATGLDLIPHRDFWREVPYMLQDVVSHLCSSFRPRHSSSRGGYIAV
ncbi:autophagy-related protein 27 [Vararia minispora EC-137]|uniref:Autophagy-related protein 27 n=1 Tax=Vararia minispora EC-137 TaxID=1314806 RepID=A0ACB8Q990_9AGAM|nr:autophagy-related protein 27 [Vararia minispora EC-137]